MNNEIEQERYPSGLEYRDEWNVMKTRERPAILQKELMPLQPAGIGTRRRQGIACQACKQTTDGGRAGACRPAPTPRVCLRLRAPLMCRLVAHAWTPGSGRTSVLKEVSSDGPP
ncbi:uncharacterized protein BP5553_08681 [Venustampulla echinocandica]|uniref:Uncharacterized protein n=1 Tax=Venustampulla echinocandica TaxID=2656787 RepID=A0A370TEX4_9HELO|nr:uncharacterized protein BP5553_08681 [Venustampulla echinocandica]RDL33242.1 hypothetical protein BP5553_08681 [Venustampulla echinocandica]